MKVLRTPDERFEELPGYGFEPHYCEVPAGDGSDTKLAAVVVEFVRANPEA